MYENNYLPLNKNFEYLKVLIYIHHGVNTPMSVKHLWKKTGNSFCSTYNFKLHLHNFKLSTNRLFDWTQHRSQIVWYYGQLFKSFRETESQNVYNNAIILIFMFVFWPCSFCFYEFRRLSRYLHAVVCVLLWLVILYFMLIFVFHLNVKTTYHEWNINCSTVCHLLIF